MGIFLSRQIRILFFCAALLALRAAPAKADESPDAWDKVLSALGLTRESCRFDFADMANYGGGEFLLPFFDAMHREPLRIPFYARVFKRDVLAAAPSLGDLAQVTSWRMNEGTRRTLIGNPLEDIEKSPLHRTHFSKPSLKFIELQEKL